MSNLMAARTQMALSLGFHIIFAAFGIALPLMMAAAHYQWLRRRDVTYLQLTRAWLKPVAIFFATGAVSGTVLSFELGLLWPAFMRHAGAIIGMPFSWEGTAFFIEAIAIGIYLYGWGRIPRWWHWASGVVVGLSGVLSGMFVVCANAWMNAPAGFRWVDGEAVDIDPWAAMFNQAALAQGVHMTIAAVAAVGFAVAGVHALGVLKHPTSALHRQGLRLALGFASVAALVQPLHGDRLGKQVARLQPAKMAAMEALFTTQAPAPLLLGGWPDQASEQVRYGLHVPRLLSFLAHGDLSSEVAGLDQVAKADWPPVAPTHIAFQLMVGIGTLLAGVGALALYAIMRRRAWLYHRRMLRSLVLMTPLGFVAIEAGWVTTEVGRQPWIIQGIMRTAEAVTPMPHLVAPLAMFSAVYLLLALLVSWLLVRQFRHAR